MLLAMTWLHYTRLILISSPTLHAQKGGGVAVLERYFQIAAAADNGCQSLFLGVELAYAVYLLLADGYRNFFCRQIAVPDIANQVAEVIYV